MALSTLQITTSSRVSSAVLIGMINYGITGTILPPPSESKSFTPSSAIALNGYSVSRNPSKNRGK